MSKNLVLIHISCCPFISQVSWLRFWTFLDRHNLFGPDSWINSPAQNSHYCADCPPYCFDCYCRLDCFLRRCCLKVTIPDQNKKFLFLTNCSQINIIEKQFKSELWPLETDLPAKRMSMQEILSKQGLYSRSL